MGQKMLFNHNNYKGIDPVPKESELLLDILYSQPDDFIIQVKKNIECFSKYKKPGTKKTLTHFEYVYRTLTNVEAFTSFFPLSQIQRQAFLPFCMTVEGRFVGTK